MGISSFFKNMFNRRNVNINNLINISDSFVVPTRELFKENPEVLGLIDTYKDEYKRVLSDKKLLFSMDLTNNINEDIRMYSELITNIFTRDEKPLSAVETKVGMFYKVNKLNLYKEETSKLHLECMARLVALLEIFNERKVFMSKHKRDALLFAINNLINASVVFEAQRSAIEMEKEHYLKAYSMIDINDEIVYEQKRTEFIRGKIDLLDKVLPVLDKKFVSPDLSYNLPNVLILERELEIHLYKTKSDVDDLKAELDDYYKLLEDQDALASFCMTEEIYKLERRALLYFYYGKNLLGTDYMYKLYELKFVFMVFRGAYFPARIPYLFDIEKEVYEHCVYKRIQSITSGRNPVITKLFGMDSILAIRYIVELLKIDGKLDAEKILAKGALRFLLAFDYDDGYIKNLNLTEVNPQHYADSINFNGNILVWDYFVPIASIYELYRLKMSTSEPDDAVYKLYKLYQKNCDSYKMPEGIKKIFVGSPSDYKYPIVKNISKSINGGKLILPNSLVEFYGKFLARNSVEEIVWNDNLKKIGIHALSCSKSQDLVIPPTLESITNDEISLFSPQAIGVAGRADDDDKDKNKTYTIDCALSQVKTIVFQDYRHSKVLKDIESLKRLFVATLYFDEINTKIKTSVQRIDFMENDEVVFSVDIDNCIFKISAFTKTRPRKFNNIIRNYEVEWCIKRIKLEVEMKEIKQIQLKNKMF